MGWLLSGNGQVFELDEYGFVIEPADADDAERVEDGRDDVGDAR